LLGHAFAGQRQGIDQMRQAHPVMIAFHRLPGMGEGMFVIIALAFFDLYVDLDTPAVARAEVAALMDIGLAQPVAGEPDMASLSFNDLAAVGIDCWCGAVSLATMNKLAIDRPAKGTS